MRGVQVNGAFTRGVGDGEPTLWGLHACPPATFSVGNWEAAWPMRPTAHFILPPRNSRDSAARRKCLLLGHHGILSPHGGRIVPAFYFLAIALGEHEHIFLFSSISPCFYLSFPLVNYGLKKKKKFHKSVSNREIRRSAVVHRVPSLWPARVLPVTSIHPTWLSFSLCTSESESRNARATSPSKCPRRESESSHQHSCGWSQ